MIASRAAFDFRAGYIVRLPARTAAIAIDCTMTGDFSAIAVGEGAVVACVIARSPCDQAIQPCAWGFWIASRWLAMTIGRGYAPGSAALGWNSCSPLIL